MVGGRCWCYLGRRVRFWILEGEGFLGRRFRRLGVVRLLMGLGTMRV